MVRRAPEAELAIAISATHGDTSLLTPKARRAAVLNLAELLALVIRKESGLPEVPSVSIKTLANRLHVPVHMTDMPEDGILSPADSSPYVLINSGQPRARQRFTLAHELTHYILRYGLFGTCAMRAGTPGFGSEEYFCDRVAAALLMPNTWIENYSGTPANLATLYAIARSAHVSLSAALVRLRDLTGWRQSLLQYRRRNGRWELVGEAGLFPAQLGMSRTTEGTQHALGLLLNRGICSATLPIIFNRTEVLLAAEIDVARDQAVALVRLPYVPPGNRIRPPSQCIDRTGSLASVRAARAT